MKRSPWLIRRLQIALEAANALSTAVSEKTERKAADFKPTEDLQLDKGRIIREYVTVLDNGNEETWLEGLPSMGPGADIPHLFRCPGGKVCSLGGCCLLISTTQVNDCRNVVNHSEIETRKLVHIMQPIRNKQISKRETEKLVKEVWKEKLKDRALARQQQQDLPDFIYSLLLKKIGIASSVIEVRPPRPGRQVVHILSQHM